ncbi:MAG TPA: hypothetical protein VIR65_09290 [Rhizorhapis sp.]
MERKQSEGSKGAKSHRTTPDDRNPNKAATGNTDVESLEGNRNADRTGGHKKGA